MTQTPDLSLLLAVLIVLAGLALQGFVAWLVWRVIVRWRWAQQAQRTQRAMAQESKNLAHVDTAPLAIRSIRDRHEAAHRALRILPAKATPEAALRTLRLHLPINDFAALTTDLTQLWDMTVHPAYLAAMAGLALEHLDGGLAAVHDFREILLPVFDFAPERLILQLSHRLQRRADKLGLWILAGGLDDVRRSAALRQRYAPDVAAAAALAGLWDGLQHRGKAVATDFAAWSVARCEAAGTEGAEDALRELTYQIAFGCRPLMGEPINIVHRAFSRHRDDPHWREAALSFDAMVVDIYAVDANAYDGALRDFDFTAALDRLREGLKDHDYFVANAAGNAASQILEAGFLDDRISLLTLQDALDWSQNIHWPRPPGQQRLLDLLAKTPAELEAPASPHTDI